MKLTAETQAILKNFAIINPNLWIEPGNKLSTIAQSKSIIATAKITENFESPVGIYDLGNFLGLFSLFQDPEIEFNPTHMTLSKDKNSVKYVYAAKNILLCPPDKEIRFPDAEIDVDVTAKQLADITKASSVLGLPDISFQGKDGVCSVVTHSIENPSSHEFRVDLGKTDLTYRMDFKVDSLKILPGDYKVSISSQKIAKFENQQVEVDYLVVCSTTSKFEG